LLERAFCKDFILNLNLREDIYPEYPILEGAKTIKRVQNVWRSWLEDSYEDAFKSFELDRSEGEDFYISTLIRDPEDGRKCKALLLQNFDIIKIYQKHL